MKKIIPILLLFILAGLAIGYFMWNKPHRDISGSEADYTLSAEELFSFYSENEDSANTLYLEKVLQLKGEMQGQLNLDNPEEPTLFLSTGDDFGVISCGFPSSALKDLQSIASGTELTVKGLCKGRTLDVVLTNCTIIEDHE